LRAWRQSSPSLPYYTLKRRDWAELPSGRFLYRKETRKRLVRWDHARWTADMILHDALPKDDAAAVDGAFIEHHFAQSIAGIEDKQDLYSLLYAVRLAAKGKRSRPTFGIRTAHVVRDAIVKGALFRGGGDGLRLAWAVSKTHARKYQILREIEAGGHQDLLALFRAERYEDLFKEALARLAT
jgi:(heptosyl)LPS beta-1,4-glucosyltransferase